MSLPVRTQPYSDASCRAYFGNLLFEGRELERVVAAHGLDRDDFGGLLYHLGSDCQGAVSVTPEGTGPGKRPGRFPTDYDELTSGRFEAIVRSLHFRGCMPEGENDPSPVAGVQPKLALVHHEGRYFLPREGSRAPTTHILKVAPRDDQELPRRESALLTLAGKLNLPAAEHVFREFVDHETGTDIGTLLSTRFDRTFDGRFVSRIHTEDLCQALGLDRDLKYERKAEQDERRFSLEAVGRVAVQTAAPGQFLIRFFEQTLFNLAVGNTDNHAKNTSIVYRGVKAELSPLYDVIPVIMDARVTHQLAVNLGEARWTEDVTLESLLQAMDDLGFLKPKFGRHWVTLMKQVARDGIPILEAIAGKGVADAVASQLAILEENTGIGMEIPARDYFPRAVRDADPEVKPGGWGGFS